MPENDSWYTDIPVIGKMTTSQAAEKLTEIGEEELARSIAQAKPNESGSKEAFSGGWFTGFKERAWQHTAHAFGYLAPNSEPIVD